MNFEFYETPIAFTTYLQRALRRAGLPDISGRIAEPCVGSGAIIRGIDKGYEQGNGIVVRRRDIEWCLADLDPRWVETPEDATKLETWQRLSSGGRLDWVVSNPPFTQAIPIIQHAQQHASYVAMHLRSTIHEPLKRGVGRTWLRDRPPTAVFFLPRFAYQRSKTTGKWATDSAAACWCVWAPSYADEDAQVIDYADEQCFEDLKAETKGYRARMDAYATAAKVAA